MTRCALLRIMRNCRLQNESEQMPRQGGRHSLVTMGGDLCFDGRGFESQHHILDGHLFTFLCCKNCIIRFVLILERRSFNSKVIY